MNRSGFPFLRCVLLAGMLLGVLTARAWQRGQPAPAQAAADWPDLALGEFITGLKQPTFLTHANDASGRLFVTEQAGIIRIIQDGVVLERPFLDIRPLVSLGGERGLLSMAFAPGCPSPGHFYINYTDNEGDTVVARYQVSDDPNRADPASADPILTIDQPSSNHNGGQLAFGPDGYLYIGMGDGGDAGDPDNYAQRPQTLLGNILRIDVESEPVSAEPMYNIPDSNPFVNTPGYRPEIWALGVRNPWRFSFDRQTGDMYMADVGQGRYEEVNVQPASSQGGENYGWSCKEGFEDYASTVVESCDTLDLTPPVHAYDRSQGDQSVTGGFVYRGTDYEAMQGIYFYGDFVSGRIWGLQPTTDGWTNRLLLETGSSYDISSFGEDQAGNLYVVLLGSDAVAPLIDAADPREEPGPLPERGDEQVFLPLVQSCVP